MAEKKTETKSEAAERADRSESRLKRLQAKAAEMEEQFKQVGIEVLTEGLSLVGAGTAGYMRGRYQEDYTILGVDAAVVVGVPLMGAGFAASLMGFPAIGKAITASGRGFVLEAVAHKAFVKGSEREEEKGEKRDKPQTGRNHDGTIDGDGDPTTPKGIPDYTIDQNGVRRTGSGVTVHRTNRYAHPGG